MCNILCFENHVGLPVLVKSYGCWLTIEKLCTKLFASDSTRISVTHLLYDIQFLSFWNAELMKKLSTIDDGDIVLKYQLIPEDLDSLVSVRNDEDVKHMMEEYDRHGSEGTPRLRAFLFPSTPVVVESQIPPMDPLAVEQRYIDAINGIVRTTTNGRLTPIKATRSSCLSSACSSPKSGSPDSMAVESMPHESILMDGYQNSRLSMHKVQSSPSLYNLSNPHLQSSSVSPHHFYQNPQHYYQNHHQPHPPYQPHRPAPLPVSTGPVDLSRGPIGHGQALYHSRSYSASRNYLGLGTHNKYAGFDESMYGCRRSETAGSLPHSPKKSNFYEGKGSG